MDPADSCRYYFVDEAGDGTLFDRKGKLIIGTEGCSRYFILGVLDVSEPEQLSRDLNELRSELCADPYFRKVPSMQAQSRKTYYSFHAKDDLPEVRREVFSVLRKQTLRFLSVVRNKNRVAEYVWRHNQIDPSYRYNSNELYDYMVRLLFKNLLHKDDHYEVVFSKRGKQDRTEALKIALNKAQRRFTEQYGIPCKSQVNIYPKTPAQSGGLQAVDYFLWALQRFYELKEDRFVELLWDSFRLVHDLDDASNPKYGVYYTQKRPLTLAAFNNSKPGI